MKKIFAGLLLSGIAICHVSGQTALEGNKFSDNWSIGINVGGVTPLTHHSFFKNMRSAVGVHVSKHLTPTFGLGFEAMGYFNTTKLLQKSEMRKNMVMDLIYRGFIYAANYSESHYNPRRSQIKTELRYLFVTTPNR